MELPDARRAIVEERKVIGYVLSESNPEGRHKAAFFRGLGFVEANWSELAEALKRHAFEHGVVRAEARPHGVAYIVEGALRTPLGREALVRAVWIREHETSGPRLVTAYPLRGGRRDS